MTQVSTIRGNIETIVAGVLTAHAKLPNPYALERNSETALKKGFGVKIGSCENSQRFISGFMSLRRQFDVVITNQVTANETNATGHQTLEKTLMEYALLVKKAFEQNPSVSEAAMVGTAQGDTGIEFISTEDEGSGFFATTIVLIIEYKESLT